MRVLSRALERVLFLAGLLGLGAAALAQLDAFLYEARERPRLEALLGEERQARSSPSDVGEASQPAAEETRMAAAAGRAWGRLEVPRVGVSSLVAEGTDAETLRVAVGHLRHSPFPGEGGNVALAGHRDSVFRGLKDVARGDTVRLETPDGVFDYRVQWTEVVEPTRTDVLAPTGAPALTLVTCYPFTYVGRAPLRFVVRASRVAAPGEEGTDGRSRFVAGGLVEAAAPR